MCYTALDKIFSGLAALPSGGVLLCPPASAVVDFYCLSGLLPGGQRFGYCDFLHAVHLTFVLWRFSIFYDINSIKLSRHYLQPGYRPPQCGSRFHIMFFFRPLQKLIEPVDFLQFHVQPPLLPPMISSRSSGGIPRASHIAHSSHSRKEPGSALRDSISRGFFPVSFARSLSDFFLISFPFLMIPRTIRQRSSYLLGVVLGIFFTSCFTSNS